MTIVDELREKENEFFLLNIPDLHRIDISSGEPLPDTANLHGGSDQIIQRTEDRRTAAAHIRYRRQCVCAHATVQAGPVHCY